MKDYLRNALYNLNPIGECEGKSKVECIEWAFEQGYGYRKSLTLTGLSHKEYDARFSDVKNILGKTSEVLSLEKFKELTEQLHNPKIEKLFYQHEVAMKLYDAKFRGLIDGDQLFKLLDYFEEKEKDEDKSF